ncbi:MAG: excinuclease ABC subunit UvrC [Clostridia bacterium]
MEFEKIKEKVKDLPLQSGVYIMYSAEKQILYIGKAKVLKNRVSQYFNSFGNKTNKVLAMVSKIADFDYIITRNEIEALVLENNLIKKHKPPYNILLKDDKSYPFIRIDVKQQFPRVEVIRKLRNDGARYFGPYMQGISSKDILDLIHFAFPLRTCKHDFAKLPRAFRPCLNYHMEKCKAPCVGKISATEYSKIIEEVIAFLNGNDKNVTKLLEDKMLFASENENYELALDYKKQLAVLDKLVRKQVTALPKDFDMDIFSIASNGLNTVVSILFVRGGKLVGGDKQIVFDIIQDEKVVLSNFIMRYYDTISYIAQEIITAIEIEDVDVLTEYLSGQKGSKVNIVCPKQGVRRQLADISQNNAQDYLTKSLSMQEREDNMTIGAVMQLQEVLQMKKMPLRMECYDISHIQGTDKVGSMVVFESGLPRRQHYRKFKIKDVDGNNDFASLQETIKRRLTHMCDKDEMDESFKSRPDLIVIDGGKGQLSSVMEVARKFDIDGIQFVSLAEREEDIYLPDNPNPVFISKSSYAIKLLQRLRDEAHRFAITFHRDQRAKRQTHSVLLDIEGIGESKAKILLSNFGSIKNIKTASVEELSVVKGITLELAKNIFQHFHKD